MLLLLLLQHLVAPVRVGLVHKRLFRMSLHAIGIPQGEDDGDQGEQQPAHQSVAQARERLQPRQALCNADGERVEQRTGKAHMRGHIAHQHARHRVVPHGDGQRHEYRHKSKRLLAHSEDSTESTE